MTLSKTASELYRSIRKIDAHMHLNSDRTALQIEAEAEGFELLTINTEVPFFPAIAEQQKIAVRAGQKHAVPVHHIATFSTENWGTPFWQDQAIEQIKSALNDGAVGVKIWKNIGMQLKDSSGKFVMPDHPALDPVYSYLSRNKIPLLAHLGEPKNCWLPIEQMTVTSDRDYFAAHPQYHMYNKSQFPSYTDHLKARDHIITQHPDLILIGAHLASLEWNVESVGKWLDENPACGVDLAERVCHLQYQASLDHQKVKLFFETYQNRIIYGSDQIDDGISSGQEVREQIKRKWRSEFRFMAESSIQTAWNVEKKFRGLGLSKNILQKIYKKNALRYYPGLTKSA